MSYQKHTRRVYACRCERCGHVWETRALPKGCARCKSRSWDVPKKSLPPPDPTMMSVRKRTMQEMLEEFRKGEE